MSILNTKKNNGLSVEEKEAVLDHMARRNEGSYNLTKAAEELQELALVLLQRVHKGGMVPTKEIIDEIGDVEIRVDVLKRIFSKEAVEERVNKKLTKYRGYIDTNKHRNI